MTLYHGSTNVKGEPLTDAYAEAFIAANKRQIEAMGGTLDISRSFGYGPAYVVLVLPEGTPPDTSLIAFVEVDRE